jgi:glycosyltransferase involved in cell wall biosynthesis
LNALDYNRATVAIGPAISVIVPVYNTAEFLRTSLDSVVSQTLRDMEIIIVNDASTDDSQRIIDEYARRDRRIRVVRHEINQGLHVARINGFLGSSGRYIAYVDSDDYVPAYIFEFLHRLATERHADVIRMSAQIIDETDATPRHRNAVQYLRFADATYGSGVEYLDTDFYPAMWLHLHHRALWLKALPHFPRIRLIGEDNLTSFVLAWFANTVVSSSQIGYHYVERSQTLMGDGSLANIARHIQDRGEVVRLLKAFVEQCGGRAEAGLNSTIDNNRGLLFSYIRSLQREDERQQAISLFEEHWQERVPDELR